MPKTLELMTELYVQECIDCGITFGFPKSYDARLRETHANFFCPNGHSMCYTGKTEAEKLRDELKREQDRRTRLESSVEFWKGREQTKERQLRAHKGVVTKLRKRVANGVCPCCHAKFKNLRDHMREQHPDWNPEQGAEAIAEKQG